MFKPCLLIFDSRTIRNTVTIICCVAMANWAIWTTSQIHKDNVSYDSSSQTSIGLTIHEERHSLCENILRNAKQRHMDILMEFFSTNNVSKVFIFQLPNHDNKGDSAIAVGEFNVLSAFNVTVVGYSAGAGIRHDTVLKRVEQNKPSKLALCFIGGGNMGIWPPYDAERGRILNLLPDHPAIIFAQSTAYEENSAILKSVQDDFRKHQHLTVLLRDRASYEFAQSHFDTKSVLSPDMAFHIGLVRPFNQPAYDIIWLKRFDRERVPLERPSFPANISYVVSDFKHMWPTPRSPLIRDSFLKTYSGLCFLQRGRVLITERLHGHILATLLGMPHVVIDTKFHKLSNFRHTWTKDIENTHVASNSREAVQLALQLLEKYGGVIPQKLPIVM